jgi:hypothetical protein
LGYTSNVVSIKNTHVRLRDVDKDKDPFQSKTKYGLHKRAFTDDFQFRVEISFQFWLNSPFCKVGNKSQTFVAVWGVIYESAVHPRVVSNFYKEFPLSTIREEVFY